MTKKLVSFDDQAEPGQGLPAAVKAELSATYGTKAELEQVRDTLQATLGSPLSADILTGYERTVPTPDGIWGPGIRTLARDPLVPGRVWGWHIYGSGELGFTDDHAETWVKRTPPPAGAMAGIPTLMFANGYAWMTQVPNSGTKRGQVWRSPYPDADGNGLSWTKVFDFASPPSGLTTGLNANFRNDCIAVSGPNVYIVEYTPAISGSTPGDAIPGGPSIFYSPSSGGTWHKVKTFANAKHIHAVRIINGIPWVTVGDAGSGWTDRGLWSANKIGVDAVWTRRSQSAEADAGVAGNDLYPINIIGMDIGGAPMVVGESDGRHPSGPLVFQGQSASGTRPLIELNRVPLPYFGSMRHIILTPENNLMWLQTGEGGAIGDFDTIMVAKGPFFSEAVPCETFPASQNLFASAGDAVLDGDYVWFGRHRIKRPLFPGQVRVQPDPVPNPPVVPNPVVGPDHEWDASTLPDDGQPVASWPARIGTFTLQQATTGAQPVVATVGGQKVARFDGVGDFLQTSGYIHLQAPYTMLIRATVPTTGTHGVGLLYPDGPGVPLTADSNGRLTLTPALQGADGDIVAGSTVTVAGVVDGANSVLKVAGGGTYTGTVSVTSTGHVRIGYQYAGGGDRFAQIDVHKVAFYRRALTGQELTDAIAAMG